ncbi:aspartyl-phosphate phosphatase Spo0E family protein [Halobacillus salinarum]|uniref:Aspartyl-phosphate phosphatase Spo0E family protein n=1 Tax=Halobacillus salinarum TaxID=2932257 RepID=A0ABY4EJ98_9BACI|nr:aspartyl-phosphate phosphatase Spo0E family protein [Halobacillus salinarum]UOQ44127.1 aspartyl-phosphate phosphatase Spo0E family protein [Halobacillus salinarum]
MTDTRTLENEVEEIRWKMYEAYQSSKNYEEILKVSQQLDHLLNEFTCPARENSQ